MFFLKEIHIGKLISQKVIESGIEISRICNFLKCKEEQILQTYESKSIDAETLLRWSKLLEYDFFRIYSQHLIMYAPPASTKKRKAPKKQHFPYFVKISTPKKL